ncbi:hypothetical protein B0H13DRAFT_1572521, partial [Mycena leptocephala]
TLQHRWINEKKNVMPEIGWSQLRHRWTKISSILGSTMDGTIQEICYRRIRRNRLVFRWVFIPWLQKELDAYRVPGSELIILHKVLPHGVPNHIDEAPEEYGILSFKASL